MALTPLSLQPCHFDYAVFCPNFTEVSVASNAGESWAVQPPPSPTFP